MLKLYMKVLTKCFTSPSKHDFKTSSLFKAPLCFTEVNNNYVIAVLKRDIVLQLYKSAYPPIS